MICTFLNASGVVLFVRDDMEQGEWTQEEYTVNATFPLVMSKKIERGQIISFRDPATDGLEFFEIRNVTTISPDAYQQIIAEHIAVSELSDEHCNTSEITDKTPSQALTTVLTGTLWTVGNSSVSDVSSVDIARGSVWQAVCAIKQNWNCYIEPRVTVNASGNITGRYLDITPATGTFRGVRLSIEKNMTDASVVVDDTETLTALYGYGANVEKTVPGGDDEQEELTFKDVVWTATDEHPAKPANQTYLEDPAATALYGRNGRPRFGYYQNANIKDAEVLLEKTWEALQQTSKPKFSISGTVVELYRFGYADQPMRVHDMAIVEITDTGELCEKQIIKLTVDLVNPQSTRPEIGDYIPNIIYIDREINEKTGGGGGGGRGQSNYEAEDEKFFAGFEKTSQMIGMVVGTKNGEDYIKAGQIVVAINDDGGTTALIQADVIDIDGLVSYFEAEGFSCGDLDCQGSLTVDQNIDCEGTISGYVGSFDSLNVTDGTLDCLDIDCNDIDAAGVTCTSLSVGETPQAATWQTYTARFCTMSPQRYFMVATSTAGTSVYGTVTGRIATAYTDTTLHYLGYPDS